MGKPGATQLRAIADLKINPLVYDKEAGHWVGFSGHRYRSEHITRLCDGGYAVRDTEKDPLGYTVWAKP